MRIALDATYALDPEPTGVARYSQRLIAALEKAGSFDITLTARSHRFPALRRAYPASRFRRRLIQEPLNLLLPRNVDLFHGLNQRLPRYKFRKQVVTIHDLFVLSGEPYSTNDFQKRFSEFLIDAVRRADAFITVSAATRDDLVRRLNVDPARITVVHHGIDPVPSRTRVRADPPFLLSVGAVQVRKNTLAAVQVIERLPKPVRLKIAGGSGFGANEVMDYVRKNNLADRIDFLGHADEETLDRLYQEASLLIFPSLDEGFGFPVIEAMARGLPVVAAWAGAIPEISGDTALLEDPRDVAALAASCKRVLDDPALAADLSARGRTQAAKFTWERAARETIAVYNRVLGL